MAEVILKKGEGRALKSGSSWIYNNEIAEIRGAFAEGDVVTVLDFDGWYLGRGFLNTKSVISVRVMTRRDEPVDRAFLERGLRRAWEYRKTCVDTSSCRLVFGEADGFPGLVIDKFSDVLVVESLALGIDRMKQEILELLKAVLLEDGVRIRGIYERSDAPVRRKEGMELFCGFLSEPFDTKVPIEENGVKYLVDVAGGQKTGFFLDQKYNRLAVQRFAKGAKVLDCFTHTGAFALNAGKAGAKDVLAVDASETAILQARENAALNGLSDTVRFETADVFELLPSLYEQGERYDLVILDPPAFTKSRDTIKRAVKGYREINYRGMKLVKDGGYLATCSCSHFMDAELLLKTIKEAARSAHVRLRQVEFRQQAPDHPVVLNAEESFYLKFWIFQVLDDER